MNIWRCGWGPTPRFCPVLSRLSTGPIVMAGHSRSKNGVTRSPMLRLSQFPRPCQPGRDARDKRGHDASNVRCAGPYSGPMPAALTTCSATTRSSAICLANSSGVSVAPTRLLSLSCFCRSPDRQRSPRFLGDAVDDRARRIGRREQSVPAARGRAVIADLLERRHFGEIRRVDIVHHHQRRHRAGTDLADDIALAEQPDRRRAGHDRSDRLAAALEGHPHPVGAALAASASPCKAPSARPASYRTKCRALPSTARPVRRHSSLSDRN